MTATVTVTYDAYADAAYIYLRAPRPGDRVRCTLICEQEPGNPVMVLVDVDLATGRLAGMEVIGAWAGLPPELLEDVVRIDERHAATRFAERMGWMSGAG